uniref:Receptor expression-enhancing protein n=1 Tax=Acrobeloides nanus TaxID=290746 RepID=A0A914CEI4_9BILA
MDDVKTAIFPSVSMVETQFSDPRTALDSDGLLDKLREEFQELLNHSALEPAFAPIEKNCNIKREQIGYGIAALLGLYLIFGSAAQLICNLIGFAYPAYVSVKAIRTKTKSDDTQWLVYWTVFATFSLIDFFGEGIMRVFPIYYLLKATFLFYLYLPQVNDASSVYMTHVEPAILKLEKIVHDYIKQMRS